MFASFTAFIQIEKKKILSLRDRCSYIAHKPEQKRSFFISEYKMMEEDIVYEKLGSTIHLILAKT